MTFAPPGGSTALASGDPVGFKLPPSLEATAPPEARGIARDAVRLLVVRRGSRQMEHARFSDLPRFLGPGDVLVVNTSATVPARLSGHTAGGEPAAVHLSGRLPGGLLVVEPRHVNESGVTLPWLDVDRGTCFRLAGGATACLRARLGGNRLWIADLELPPGNEGGGSADRGLLAYVARHGRPIRYSYVPEEWPISYYQTVFAEVPGSAEMPSAARPFSAELTTRLVARGVEIAPFVLHCGVSSPEAHEMPQPEWYSMPPVSADRINHARRAGHAVVAVGTTAVRALETVADERGNVHPGQGWTEVVVTPERGVMAVDGLITGWHEPGASHLSLLEAVAGADLVAASYREALGEGYLWHEFGDSHLVLP